MLLCTSFWLLHQWWLLWCYCKANWWCASLFLRSIWSTTYIHIVHFVSVASDRHRSPSLPLVKHNRVGTVLFILTAVRKRDLKTDNKIQLTLWEHWWKKAGSRLWMSIFVKLSIPSCSEICHFLNHFSPHGIFKSILHTHPNNSFNIKVQTYY